MTQCKIRGEEDAFYLLCEDYKVTQCKIRGEDDVFYLLCED